MSQNNNNPLNPGRKPNSKGKIEVHAGIRDFYKYYRDKYKNSKHELVEYKIYSKVLKKINEAISKAIIYEGLEFKIPGKLGYISIVRNKTKLRLDENGKLDTRYLPVDFKATRKLWKETYPDLSYSEILKIPNKKRVYQSNNHTAGFIYKWYFNKFTSNATNKSVYFFKASRTNKRELAAYIKSEDFENKYFTL